MTGERRGREEKIRRARIRGRKRKGRRGRRETKT